MLDECGTNVDKAKERLSKNFDEYNVYPDSIYYLDGSFFFLALVQRAKKLIIYHEGNAFDKFTGDETDSGKGKVKICDLSNENCILIREIFPFTNPSTHKGINTTVGLGDRLGIASAGHIQTLKGKKVFPVLAQQSIRELNLTVRDYNDVLAAASWAVFQEGYTSGFGADGDHLKTAEEVKMAIGCGFTMITLDCSEHIDNSIPALSQEDIDELYMALPDEDRKLLESKYLGAKFKIDNESYIEFKREEFKKIVLIYLKAIRICAGLGPCIEIPAQEMYGEPFDIPEPDELVFLSWFQGGEVFRSGCCFRRGRGRIFYFSPGHETFPIYRQPEIVRVIANGVRWATAPHADGRMLVVENRRQPLEPLS
jgi:hypothetical protein